ncbi:MAG TPA: DUF429 domain-containing protein [Acidimicrobiales bacterium]|nr:DUF429 domain-containing protein [Acidimicrobiales bacterium]
MAQPSVTVGVDLAASPTNTAACSVRWLAGHMVVERAENTVEDANFIELLRQLPDGGRLGLDCPLGWPVDVVAAVVAHHGGEPWPMRRGGGDRGPPRWRATDRWLQERNGHWPLSVSTDRLGVTALRCAYLLDQWEAVGGTVDRRGLEGPVLEVYPAAARRAWGLSRVRSVEELEHCLPMHFEQPAIRDLCTANEHCFDALVAALVARAAALGRTSRPPAGALAVAAVEGWIHVPTCPLDELVGPRG